MNLDTQACNNVLKFLFFQSLDIGLRSMGVHDPLNIGHHCYLDKKRIASLKYSHQELSIFRFGWIQASWAKR
jgi:hypothetical protein